MAMDRESCTLALPYSNTTFYITFVKLYFTPIAQIEGIKVELASRISKKPSKELAPLLVKRNKRQLRKNPNIIIFF